MNDKEEVVILVDEHDRQIGLAKKLYAHEKGLLHRAFSIFVFKDTIDGKKLLLQQRDVKKYHAGGLWTNTCCSHPRDGESVLAAGRRRLQEELGFCLELEQIGSFCYRANFSNGLIEHEYDHVLIGNYNNEAINCNPDEVQDFAWVSINEFEEKLSSTPAEFTPWLAGAWDVVKRSEVLKA